MNAIILIICTVAGFGIYGGFVRPIVCAFANYRNNQQARRIAEQAQVASARRAAKNVGNKNARP